MAGLGRARLIADPRPVALGTGWAPCRELDPCSLDRIFLCFSSTSQLSERAHGAGAGGAWHTASASQMGVITGSSRVSKQSPWVSEKEPHLVSEGETEASLWEPAEPRFRVKSEFR